MAKLMRHERRERRERRSREDRDGQRERSPIRALPAAVLLAAIAATAALAPAALADPAATTAQTIASSTPSAAPAAPAAPAPITAAPAAPAPIAAPRFELLDRGDAVEVIAHGVKATRTAIMPVRQRLEVSIAAPPQIKRITPGDATVKLVEIAEESTPVLSVKLGFERADVKALSRFAQAIQIGDDLHLLVPRKLPEGDAAPPMPEPTALPALAAHTTTLIVPAAPAAPTVPKAQTAATPAIAPATATAPTPPAAIAPVAAASMIHPATPVLGPRPDPSAPLPAAGAHPRSAADAFAAGAMATSATSAPDRAPAGTVTTAPTDGRAPLRPVLASDRDDAWSRLSMFGAVGLAAAGAGVWLMRRRRTQTRPLASIEVIAQRSLGGKARIVWLSAGQHEMIVSVTAQQVRMLSQWRKTEATGSSPMPRLYPEDEPRREPTLTSNGVVDKPLSPAVSGLLRLRRTSQMAAVAVEPPDGDVEADSLWAKEILAATGARR